MSKTKSLRQIAAKEGISHERVRYIIAREKLSTTTTP